MDLHTLEKLKAIKKFGNSNHAKGVYLLEGGKIVKKIYPKIPENKPYKSYKHYFEKEIMMMEHLKDCKNVSKLLGYNRDTLTLYMTYCGKTPAKTPENLLKIYKVAKKLHKKWGVVRRESKRKVTYNIFRGNTGIIKGKIYFFDLAGDKWRIEKKYK